MSRTTAAGQEWPTHSMTDSIGDLLILRHVPLGIPRGEFKLFNLSVLTDSQRRECTAVHELGHAMVYLHFGVPVAIQIHNPVGSGAHVNPGHKAFDQISPDQIMLGLAAGEAAEVRWLGERGFSSPMENLVSEILSQLDRKSLRDNFNVTFGQGGKYNFDELLSRADELVNRYWGTISRASGELMKPSWWGWDETADRLGFPELVTPVMRNVSDGIRHAHAKGPGSHTHVFPSGHATIEVGNEGTWESFSYDYESE